jgi:DNA-binding MarR family transcriptional regulator
VPLTIRSAQDEERRRLTEDVLDELTGWAPRDRMEAFKTWLSGSVSLVHLNVLTILEAGGPQSMSRLADALDVSLASATGIVDRMERRQLVQRRPDPADRRMVVVHTLEAGTDIFRKLADHRRQSLTRLLEHLSADELSGLRTGLRGLRAARAAEVAETAASAAAHVASAAPCA